MNIYIYFLNFTNKLYTKSTIHIALWANLTIKSICPIVHKCFQSHDYIHTTIFIACTVVFWVDLVDFVVVLFVVVVVDDLLPGTFVVVENVVSVVPFSKCEVGLTGLWFSGRFMTLSAETGMEVPGTDLSGIVFFGSELFGTQPLDVALLDVELWDMKFSDKELLNTESYGTFFIGTECDVLTPAFFLTLNRGIELVWYGTEPDSVLLLLVFRLLTRGESLTGVDFTVFVVDVLLLVIDVSVLDLDMTGDLDLTDEDTDVTGKEFTMTTGIFFSIIAIKLHIQKFKSFI